MKRYRPFMAALGLLTIASTMPAQQAVHRVQPGDTLYSIARNYGVSVELILQENGIDDPRHLMVGKELKIPRTYVVAPGDTLYSISHRFDVDIERLRADNDLASDTIVVGRRLTLPPEKVDHEGAESDEEDGTRTEVASERGGQREGSEASREDRASPTVFQQQVVAETMNRPLGFAEGGSWPVAGQRFAMEGKLPGVIIKGSFGDSVTSVSSGRVVYAGPHTSFGNVVFIQSGQGYIYVYGGNDTVSVSVGEEVAAGSTIGSLGRSPAQQQPLLYFSVWKENDFVSPDKAPRG